MTINQHRHPAISNKDRVKRISHSVFVTNFLESITSRDLWKECSAYGTVVDVFIPFKKSQAGKRFAFVRFIKVFDLDRLVKNLCTIWIGRHHLFANQARFERPPKPKLPPHNGTSKNSATQGHSPLGNRSANGHTGSFVNAVNGVSAPVNLNSVISSSPALVLEDICLVEWDFSKCAIDVPLDFVSDERIAWVDIEGVPLQAWSRETFSKIGNKLGDLMSIEDTCVASFGRKRVCILTKYPTSILESFKIIVEGKVYVVRAKELFTWSPNFLGIKENLCSSDDESVSGGMHNSNHSFVSEEEEGEFNPSDGDVPETIFGDNSASEKGHSRNSKKQMSEDPFGIYKILKKNHLVGDSQPSPSLSHPPGFSPVIFGSHSSSDHAKVADKDPQINFQEA
nr:RNA-directed DNA polymerase, eukaryota, nucleotide-binding alpha-beta plait domain protein [Tanacetum cinerariifolium]